MANNILSSRATSRKCDPSWWPRSLGPWPDGDHNSTHLTSARTAGAAVHKSTILLLARDNNLLQDVQKALADSVVVVSSLHDRENLLTTLKQAHPALVIIGPSPDDAWDELSVAKEVRQADTTIPIIIVTRGSSEDRAISALKLRVHDYFKMPIPISEFLTSVMEVCRQDNSLAIHTPHDLKFGGELIGVSDFIEQARIFLPKVAASECNVLITGETGTGKERVATLIHQCSPRQSKRLMCINCAALPDSLVEGELFGYERGAFTGAATRYEGKLKLADGGSVFFDEIGDMSAYAQAKVLRAIETKEVFPLGGKSSVPIDIRLIAATNHDLESLINQNKFRKDLYYRLNVVGIELPPLRKRREDIPTFLDHYLHECNQRYNRHVQTFSDEVVQVLVEYEWPGNIRELKNLLEATFVNGPDRCIRLVDLPESFRRRCDAEKLPASERELLLQALLQTEWNKSKAAQKLHWSRMTLYRKMAKYAVEKPRAGLSAKTVTSVTSL